jgi:ABC-2 type transport system permease protein
VVTASLIGSDLPLRGWIPDGAALAGVGLDFAGFSAVAVQITEHTRTAYGITAAVLGAAFVLRAVGDVGDNAVSWLSPIGWAQAVDPYTADRTWALAVSLVATVALGALAVWLNGRRDVGAGLVASRPGSPDASPTLGHPLGLAVRMQRTAVIGWGSGVLIGGLAFGSIAHSAEDLIGDNEQLREFLAQSGATSITDSFLATMLVYMALVGAGFAIQSVLRLRSEETAVRAEPVLATAVSRWAWAGSHVAVAVTGTVLGVAGLGVGLSHGLAVGDLGQVPRLVAAAMALVPAVWVLVGVAVALFGLVPRLTVLAWGALAACVVIGMFGPLLQLPDALIRLTPFGHVPQVPAVAAPAAPLVVLTLVAAVLVVAGLTGFRRRDVG